MLGAAKWVGKIIDSQSVMIAYYIEDNIAYVRVGVCACELIISRT